MFASELKTIRRLGVRGCLQSVLNLLVMLSSGLMMWKTLSLATNSESPVVVVLSGSMEPAFYRGDILFLTNPATERFTVGDITVYKIPGADIPIVHRVIEAHDLPPSASALPDQLLLTKGDNNTGDDVDLYRGEKWLRRSNVVGKVRGFLPYVGYATIAMNDFPQLKYALLGAVGLAAVFSGES